MIMRIGLLLAGWLFLWQGLVAGDTSGQTPTSSRTQPTVTIIERLPRHFGFSLGDTLQQRIQVYLPSGMDLNHKALPTTGRINNWLELRDFNWRELAADQQQASDTSHRYELTFHYQLFLQQEEAAEITLPGSTLLLQSGKPLTLPSWTIMYAPFLPREFDHSKVIGEATKPPLIEESGLLKWACVSFATFLITLLMLLWLMGYLPLFRRQQGPFTEAYRRLRNIQRKNTISPQQAIKILQQAINQDAGSTVFPDQLPQYFKQRPQFQPLKLLTTTLIQQVHQHHYSSASAAVYQWPDNAEILRLSKRYSQLEQATWRR